MSIATGGAYTPGQTAVAGALQERSGASPMGGFFWGPNGQRMSAEEVKANRRVLEALMARNSGRAPSNVGEGLAAIGNAIAYRALDGRVDEAERIGRDEYAKTFTGLGEDPTMEGLMAAAPNGFETEAERMVWQARMADELKGPDYQTIESGGDILRYDANNPESVPTMWFDGPEAPKKAPEVTTRYNPETGLEEKMEWDAAQGAWVPFGGMKAATNGLTVTTNADGTTTVQQGGSGGKLTEAQSKDLGWYTRGTEANSNLSQLEGQLTDLGQTLTRYAPLGLGNYARTPEFRQAKVAADQFLAAILRKDTGAAITDQEFDLYGPMFLPVPGDDPGTIASKRRAREVAMLAIRSGLGTAEAIGQANRIALGIDNDTPSITGSTTANPAKPVTQADFDKLPVGAVYVDPDDGKLYRKE